MPSATASLSLAATARRTASSAHSPLRPRCAATVRANAAASLVALWARVESIGPWRFTGVAAPMFVPGAIAATSPAITTNTPADAARAPPGITQVMTGTGEASRRLTMSRMLVSRPPGVSTSTTSAR
jgi:hypothetical protein